MAKDEANAAMATMIPLIADRLKEAHGVAAAALACSVTGNHDGAFRILLDIEELTTDAITLLNAASIVRRTTLD